MIKSILTEITERAASLEVKKKTHTQKKNWDARTRMNGLVLIKPAFNETKRIDFTFNLYH